MELKQNEVPDLNAGKLTIEKSDDKPVTDVKPVTQAVVKKRSGIGRLFKNFIAEDVTNVKGFLFKDVLVPSVKNAIADLIISATNMTLFGKSGQVGRRPGIIGKVGNTNYGNMYRGNLAVNQSTLNGTLQQQNPTQVADIYDFNEICYTSYQAAEEVYVKLCERIALYNMATVANLYTFSGITTNEATYSNWGWYDIPTHRIESAGGGYYVLILPKAIPLNK